MLDKILKLDSNPREVRGQFKIRHFENQSIDLALNIQKAFQKELYINGGYENEEFAIVKQLLKYGDIAVDLGSHVWYLELFFIKTSRT